MTYRNGYLPADALAPAANGAPAFGGQPAQVLEIQTAHQWAVMVAAAARNKVFLRPQADGGVPSCYRNFAGQVAADAAEKAGGPVAATPGFSLHGWGTAVDIDMMPGVWEWLVKNAAKYGFDNVQGKASGESWHWVMTRTLSNTELAALGAVPIITTITKRKRKMFTLFRNPANGEITLLDYETMTRRALTGGEWAAFVASGAKYGNAASAAEYSAVTSKFKLK